MKPFGHCDCGSPFYLIKGLIHYSCGHCETLNPIGNCTICYAPVYLINHRVTLTCNCGTASIGNISYASGTTATLQPYALTNATFPIAPGCNSEPSIPDSPLPLSSHNESYSHASECDFDDIDGDNATLEIATRMYDLMMKQSLDHLKTCDSCKFLARRDEVCPQMKRIRSLREKWQIIRSTLEHAA